MDIRQHSWSYSSFPVGVVASFLALLSALSEVLGTFQPYSKTQCMPANPSIVTINTSLKHAPSCHYNGYVLPLSRLRVGRAPSPS